MTAPATHREHTDDRYAARTRGRDKVGHFLLLRWPETDLRRGRPALCGQVARKWLRIDAMETPPPPCPECNERAGITPDVPRRIAPAAIRDRSQPLDCPTAVVDVLDPQHARAALPTGWRPRVTPADTYVPRVDEERDYAREHARAAFAIAFPDWAPITYCSPNE